VGGKHGSWEVQSTWGTIWLTAQPGKVGVQGVEPGSILPAEARALSGALAEAADIAEAQAAVKDAVDAHGSRSVEAEAARSRLRELQAKTTDD
jgi:hypothetical protein